MLMFATTAVMTRLYVVYKFGMVSFGSSSSGDYAILELV